MEQVESGGATTEVSGANSVNPNDIEKPTKPGLIQAILPS